MPYRRKGVIPDVTIDHDCQAQRHAPTYINFNLRDVQTSLEDTTMVPYPLTANATSTVTSANNGSACSSTSGSARQTRTRVTRPSRRGRHCHAGSSASPRNSRRKRPHCRTCGSRMKGHKQERCIEVSSRCLCLICQWVPSAHHNAYRAQERDRTNNRRTSRGLKPSTARRYAQL